MVRTSVAAAVLLSLSVGAAPAVSGPEAGSTHPPMPRVTSLGVTRSATMLSYCWWQTSGNYGSGSCTGVLGLRAAHSLRWRLGANIRVDLRRPTHDVEMQAARRTVRGEEGVIHLNIVRKDPAGQHWALPLPGRAARDTDLMISASFAHGDIQADLGIRPSRDMRSRPHR